MERALECYVIVKRCKDHENLLKRPHNKPKTKHGIGYADMDKATAGDPMEWICPQCMTPRPEQPWICLFCKSKLPPIHRSEPTARMTVDEVEWTLRFDEDGNHHWEAPGISAEEKEAASIDLGQLAQAPSPCLDPEETSFSDQVPQSVRISIRQQVVTEAPDPELIDALAKKNVKMHTKEEEDPRERSYLDGPGANIAHAQTTVEEARRQNLARQAAGVKSTQELFV